MNKNSNVLLVLILFSTEENLVSFLRCCFANVLPSHFTESKDVPSVPVDFVCYSWSGPAALIALVFHVPIFDDAPVESGCTAEGAVLVDPGGDRSGMVWLLVFIIW